MHVHIALYCPKINHSQTGKKQQQLQNKIDSKNYEISMLCERMISLKYFKKLQLYKSRGLPSRKVPVLKDTKWMKMGTVYKESKN